MEFTTASDPLKRLAADALVLPFVINKKKIVPACKGMQIKELKTALACGDFRAKEGEVLALYSDAFAERRVLLLGLGDKSLVDAERLRRAYASLTKACRCKKLQKINLYLPETTACSKADVMRGVCEGLLLANYSFAGMRSAQQKKVLLQGVCLMGAAKADLEAAKRHKEIAEAVYFARDLVNGNADDVTPQYLSQVARQLAKQHKGVKVKIFDKKQLEKEKFGLLLAVGRGSMRDPALITLEYRGAPKSKQHVVLVGKGVTYDTGGLNIKPTGSMETMRMDMAGAAAVLGALAAAAALKLACNLSVVIPSAENGVDATSYKPGDVYRGYAGKSVEVGNTDAEGRLILADALAYAVKELKPTYLIDLATLTGAMDVALGPEYTGVFSNHDVLVEGLERAAQASFERVWRLPLVEEYRDLLKSDIADIKNIGGRGAGSIKGALFLEEFVNGTPWAHLDIASTAYASEARRYHPKYATGVGVRLLVDFLEQLA